MVVCAECRPRSKGHRKGSGHTSTNRPQMFTELGGWQFCKKKQEPRNPESLRLRQSETLRMKSPGGRSCSPERTNCAGYLPALPRASSDHQNPFKRGQNSTMTLPKAGVCLLPGCPSCCSPSPSSSSGLALFVTSREKGGRGRVPGRPAQAAATLTTQKKNLGFQSLFMPGFRWRGRHKLDNPTTVYESGSKARLKNV